MNDRENHKNDLIRFLGDIIENESSKNDSEANIDLIDDCGDILNDIVKEDVAVSDAEIDRKIRMITRGGAPHRTVKKGILRRSVPIVCIAALLCVSVGAAYIIEPELRDGFKAVFEKGIGGQVESGDLTFGFIGTSKKYASTEQLIKHTGLNIMYPHALPEKAEFKEISSIEETTFPITFAFDDTHYSITIYERGTASNEELINTHDTAVDINGKTFYISKCPDQWIAVAMDELYTYEICAADENDLYILINGMKYGNE